MSQHPPPSHGTRRPNLLVTEKSPYLLQHAHNPVSWHPWGPEAFERAREEDKPVFLSIGYATCHWCHVMEKECFEDEAVARLMNHAFISIKVDREERPDLDHLYMTVCTMMTGSGGWPLNLVLTPERVPFFSATYIPRQSRFGRVGMMELVPRIEEVWKTRRQDVLRSAGDVLHALETTETRPAPTELPEEVLHTAFRDLRGRFDGTFGGFGEAPKFPSPHQLLFLLRYGKRFEEPFALHMATHTLRSMANGGICDHLGFGFHRYATDRAWRLPHFEKMLYDQALLATAFCEAWEASREETFRETARQILAYVKRDLTSPEGGFYSAEDADSEGEEGRFYVWEEAEIRSLLPPAEAEAVCALYDIRSEGNFEEEATGQKTGRNVLYRPRPLESAAEALGLSAQDLADRIASARGALFEARSRRPRPSLDDKILTDWNGLMLTAFARCGRLLEDPGLTALAEKAAAFLLSHLRTAEGGLFHRYREGEVRFEGCLDDYAFLVQGLLELHLGTRDAAPLEEASRLARVMIEDFWDNEEGGFFLASARAMDLLVRQKTLYDGAIPSGNSVAFVTLRVLNTLTGDDLFETRALDLARCFSGTISGNPSGCTCLLLGLMV